MTDPRTERHVCSLCGVSFIGWGNNPEPLAPPDERCCDACNDSQVIPARLKQLGVYHRHY